MKKIIQVAPNLHQNFLKKSKPLYFLLGHSNISNQKNWTFFNGPQETQIEKFLEKRLKEIHAEKGFIHICNPLQHQLKKQQIPIAYPTSLIGISSNFSDQYVQYTN